MSLRVRLGSVLARKFKLFAPSVGGPWPNTIAPLFVALIVPSLVGQPSSEFPLPKETTVNEQKQKTAAEKTKPRTNFIIYIQRSELSQDCIKQVGEVKRKKDQIDFEDQGA